MIPFSGPAGELPEYEAEWRRLPSDVLTWAEEHVRVAVVLAVSLADDPTGYFEDDPIGMALPPDPERWTLVVATPAALLHEVAHARLGHTKPRNEEDEAAARALVAEWEGEG